MTAPDPAVGIYQLAILGDVDVVERTVLSATLDEMVAEFDLAIGAQVTLFDGDTVQGRDPGAAFAAAYFVKGLDKDLEAAASLVNQSAPLIPTIAVDGNFDQVPEVLKFANGHRRRQDDPKMLELASAMLECVGLLRRQRRVFVSYRRTEARAAAVQLHDVLSLRGFDVFLDTHSIRPAESFQDVLWHRLVDSDVIVMLDTPSYFESRWTRQEIGRARAKDIQILRVVWPEHIPSRTTDLSETVYLEKEELQAEDGPLSDQSAEDIVIRVERLRGRSLAARYMIMTGKLRADIIKIGGAIEGIGAHRAISVRLPCEKRIWAYPVVGVPTAETLNDIADKARRSNQKEAPVLVYDDIGIHAAWGLHLRWLNEHIKAVRAIKVSEAGWALVAMDDEQ